MDASEHRNVAKFLELFDEIVKSTTGYASDWPCCFAKKDFTENEKKAIVTSLREQLAHERTQVEFVEHFSSGLALEELFNFVIKAFDAGPSDDSQLSPPALVESQTWKLTKARSFASSMASGYDHDEDPHRYNTAGCRVCQAEEMLKLLNK